MLLIQFGLFTRLQRWLGPGTLIVGGFVIMAMGFALLSRTLVYGEVVTLVAFIAMGSGILLPTLSVLTADRAGPAVGTAVGFQNAAANLGQAAGSAATGLLFGAFPKVPFAAVGTLMAATALMAALSLQHRAGIADSAVVTSPSPKRRS